MLIQASIFAAILLGAAFWTTMLEPPPRKDEIDASFEGQSSRGMFYGDRRAKIFIWTVVAAVLTGLAFIRP